MKDIVVPPALATQIETHVANAQVWDGRGVPTNRLLVISPLDPELVTSLLLSIDVGMHASGWWRNSQYDRCWHLSLCSMGADGQSYQDMTQDEAQWWARAYFGPAAKMSWLEPPASALDMYRTAPASPKVWHVRLFMDQKGNPIQPEGEVYSLVPYADGSSPEKIFRS